MLRTVLAVAGTAALMGAMAPAAMADRYELVVGKSPADAAGTVTATATTTTEGRLGPSVKTTRIIDCGADCEHVVEQYSPCLLLRCELAWPVVAFKAEPADGFALTSWEGCVVPRRGADCLVDERAIERGVKVVANFDDVQAPAVQPMGPDPGTAVNGRTTLAAGASDNWGVAQVEFLAGGRSLGVDADPRDGWTLDVETAGLPEGVLALQVVATDLAGNQATGDWSIVVDRSAAVTLAATPGGFLRSAPAVPFSLPADAAAVTCRTLRAGAPAPAFSACRSPYSPVTSGDGAYTVEVAVTDAIGNRGVSSHAFTLDTTAPAGAITAGPGEGETLRRSDGAFAFTVSDASPVEVTCGLDGALAPCGGTSGFAGLPEGSHRFVLRIADAAGNVTELARSFRVDVPDAAPPAITPDPPAATPDPPEVHAPEVLRAVLFYSFAAPKRGSTKLLALRLTQLPAGSRLDVRCSGRGCPAKRSAIRVAKAGKLAIKAFAGRKLRKGTRIEIRLTKPGAVGTFWRLTVVPRKPPRFERRCLDAAGAKPIRCPGA